MLIVKEAVNGTKLEKLARVFYFGILRRRKKVPTSYCQKLQGSLGDESFLGLPYNFKGPYLGKILYGTFEA